MAWQLIYTSAPRLLEAGRTGFGTVARHRAVGGMLASTVERLSQFARLPGHDPRRIVHAHRIVTVGGGTFHVLSCLRDAGSDYTGRTNHLAHHLIAEAREARALSTAGITPADVLIAMNWRTSWADGPRFLDAAEEVDLSTLRAAPASAWTALTGNPDYARLLAAPQALKGCYVIVPPTVNALALFRESLLAVPQAGWQTSFTTCLEPNDDVGDFRWIGLPPDSPLRGQAEISNRFLIDLTQPSTLPAPPEPPARPQPVTESEQAAPAFVNASGESRSPDKVSLKPSPAQPASVTHMGSWSPEPVRTASRKKTKTLALAVMTVAVLVASTAGFFLWQHIDMEKRRADFQAELKRVWDEHGLKLTATRNRLSNEPDLEQGLALLKSLHGYVDGLRRVLKNSSSSEEPPQPEDTSNMPDFEDLQRAFEDWRKIEQHGPEPSGNTASQLLSSYDEWVSKRKQRWKAVSEHVKRVGPLPDESSLVRVDFAKTAKTLLSKNEPAKNELSTWQKLNERLGKDSEMTEWLRIWEGLDGGGKIQVAETAQTNGLLPEWLKTEAQKVLEARDKALAEKTAAERKAMVDNAARTANTPKHKIEDADSLDGTHPIFIFSSTDEAIQTTKEEIEKAAKLPFGDEKDKEVHLYIGGYADRNPIGEAQQRDKAGELTEWVKHLEYTETRWIYAEYKAQQNKADLLEFDKAGTITRLPVRAKDGLRIVARKNDNEKSVLFDIRILVNGNSGSAPLLATPVLVKPVPKDGAILLPQLDPILARIRWVNATTDYKLRLNGNGSASEQKTFDLVYNKDECLVMQQKESPLPRGPNPTPTSDLESKIRSKNQEIENYKKEVQRKTKGSQEKLDKATAELKKLQGRQAEAASQQQTPPQEPVRPPFSLPPGDYTVLRGAVEICTFKLPNGSEDNTTKSPKP